MKKLITLFVVTTMILSLLFSLDGCLSDISSDSNYDTSNSSNNSSSQNSSENDGTTMGERMALSSAKKYLKTMSFSKQGLIEQLEFEGFTSEEATYAVNNCGANWNEKVKGVQLSANAGIGVEFALGRHVGLYIDPSLRYYFDNGQPKSIRTAQPLMFGFETGLRVNL